MVKIEIGTFSFLIKTKREDKSNGFLDLKYKSAIKTAILFQVSDGELAFLKKDWDSFKLDQEVFCRISAAKMLDQEGFFVGEVKMKVIKKIESQANSSVEVAFDEVIEDVDIPINKFNGKCLSISPENMKSFFVGQQLDIIYSISDQPRQQTKIEEIVDVEEEDEEEEGEDNGAGILDAFNKQEPTDAQLDAMVAGTTDADIKEEEADMEEDLAAVVAQEPKKRKKGKLD